MAEVGVVPVLAGSGRKAVSPDEATWSTLFGPNGAILFQNEAARTGFAPGPKAPGNPCAFVSHFVDRALGRRLLAELGAGRLGRVETLVHTATGKARHRLEISPAAAPDGRTGVMVLERPAEADAAKPRWAELAEANALMRAALDNMHQGFLVTDAEARVVMWNDRFLELNGLSPGVVRSGMPGIEVIRAAARAGEYGPGDPDEQTPQRITQMRCGRDGVTRRRPNGMMIDSHTNRMPSGHVIRTYTDITIEREREIAEKTALLTTTLESMDQGIMVIDAELKVRMWNERLVGQYDLPRDFLRVGMPMIAVVEQLARQGEFGPGDPAALARQRLDETAGEAGSVFARRLKNGAVIERRRRAMPDGGFVLTHTDITTLTEREHEVENHRALLAGTLANIDQGILVLDDALRLRLWNQRVEELLDLPPGYCHVGLPVAEMVAHFRRRQGLPEAKVAAGVVARIKDFSRDHVITLAQDAFEGRVIERRRRGLAGGGIVLTYTDITEATRREQEIAEKSALLSATLESMDQGMLVLDAEMRIRIWNNRLAELMDLPPDLFRVGMPATDFLQAMSDRAGRTPDASERAIAACLVAFRTGEIQLLTGHELRGRVIERRSRPMPDGGLVVTYSDVTLAQRRENELEEKSAHLSAVLASMDQGMLVFGRDRRIRTWNQRAIELLNLKPDFLRDGLPAADFTRALTMRQGGSPEEVEKNIATYTDEISTGNVRIFSGVELAGRVIERHSLPMPDGGLVITYSNVTERKRREDLIAENSALLSATLDNMDQGLVVIDAHHRTKLWNNRLVEMFDLPSDLMQVGRPFVEILRYFIESYGTPPDQIEARLAERLVELQGEPVPVLDRHRPDGRVIERRRRVMPLGGSVITYGDVTERKRGEAALRRAKEEAEIASRSKTEFLANMSHELRTPLNAIIGFSDILVQQLFGPLGQKRYIEYAHDIRDSGQHLLSLINDVLDIAKVEVNKTELAEETVDAPEVIESCLRLMRDRATAGEVEIVTHLEPNLPRLRADDRRLKQILLNLVSNAVKFTPPGGRVEVSAGADTAGFRFVVADTGIGIAAGDIATALTPFGQIDSSIARRYQGTGLGLPLARSMTELHGGRLDIESTPGSGTTVTVWLPPSRVSG